LGIGIVKGMDGGTMADLAGPFTALPDAYQRVLRDAQERYEIEITPLQPLSGGRSGAVLYLASLRMAGAEVEHVVLKLDTHRPWSRSDLDEGERHLAARRSAPTEFADRHMVRMPLDPVATEEVTALFYGVAGDSLHQYRPLSAYGYPPQLRSAFSRVANLLLQGWNPMVRIVGAAPRDLLTAWLGYRTEPGESALDGLLDACGVPPDSEGILVPRV